MKLLFSESAVNFPSIGTHFCKKKVSGSRRKTMKGVNVLTEGKAKNGRLGHSHCDGRFCSFFVYIYINAVLILMYNGTHAGGPVCPPGMMWPRFARALARRD